jgi:hypothetical protein
MPVHPFADIAISEDESRRVAAQVQGNKTVVDELAKLGTLGEMVDRWETSRAHLLQAAHGKKAAEALNAGLDFIARVGEGIPEVAALVEQERADLSKGVEARAGGLKEARNRNRPGGRLDLQRGEAKGGWRE